MPLYGVSYVLCWRCFTVGHRISMANASGVGVFFSEVSGLIDQAERQYGLANRSYTEYVIERLKYAITMCSLLCSHMRGVSE